jgi:hypothetical protein
MEKETDMLQNPVNEEKCPKPSPQYPKSDTRPPIKPGKQRSCMGVVVPLMA